MEALLQIKNKDRVFFHGEVFTSEREVDAMLKLVEQETLRIESRFFEPACGTGNFLAKILARKLQVVVECSKKNRLEFQKFSVLAISSLYGIDILLDNVEECRLRLLRLFKTLYIDIFNEECDFDCLETVKYILETNIVWGDALTLKAIGNDSEPIVFAEWSPLNGDMIKRRDYNLAKLLEHQPIEGDNLFSDLGEKAFIPKPIKEYAISHFLKLHNHVK